MSEEAKGNEARPCGTVMGFKQVKVEWLDSVSFCDWRSIEAVLAVKVLKNVSLGLLIHQDAESMILAMSYSPSRGQDDTRKISDVTIIPRRCIVKITEQIDGKIRTLLRKRKCA